MKFKHEEMIKKEKEKVEKIMYIFWCLDIFRMQKINDSEKVEIIPDKVKEYRCKLEGELKKMQKLNDITKIYNQEEVYLYVINLFYYLVY